MAVTMHAAGERIEHGESLSEQPVYPRHVLRRTPPFPRLPYLEASRVLDLAGELMTAPQWIPGVRMLTSYRVSWLRSDLVAGIVLCTLLVPQGMAYAELAGLPPITGLYTSILCLIGYAV